MRKTTKIFIGFVIGVFALTLILYIVARLSTEEKDWTIQKLDKETVTIEIPEAQFIHFKNIKNSDDGKSIYMNGQLVLKQDSLGERKMKINKELAPPFTKMKLEGDTLVISLNADPYISKNHRRYKEYYLGNATIQLPVGSSLHLLNDISGLNVEAKNLLMDELKIRTIGSIILEENKIGRLYTQIRKNESVYISTKNEIGAYDLYLKNLKERSFKLQSNSIDTLNLYGAKSKEEYSVPHQKIKTLNWYPHKDSQPLNIQLKDSTTANLTK